jgi:hypothetical protein
MINSGPPSQPLEDGDLRGDPEFPELLAKYVEEVQTNGFVDPEEILRDHPKLGPTILEDLETYAQLQGYGAHQKGTAHAQLKGPIGSQHRAADVPLSK